MEAFGSWDARSETVCVGFFTICKLRAKLDDALSNERTHESHLRSYGGKSRAQCYDKETVSEE